MTTKTILVPTDFSDASRNASDYAVALARQMDYEVTLVHVYNTPVLVSSDMVGTMLVDLHQLEKEMKQRLKEEADYLQKKGGMEIRYESFDGLVVDEILVAEKKYEPVLIVMGMKEANALSEYIVGSTVTDILLKIGTPLLIVPEKAEFKKIERVVVANDPNLETTIEISDAIKELFEKFYSTIYIVSVMKEEDESPDKKTTDACLEKHFENRFHSYHFITNDNVIEGISEFIDLHRIDLVTMMPQKHNFFGKLFKEMHTKKLAFHTHIPLLSLVNPGIK